MIAIFPEIVHLAMNKDFESLAIAVRKYFAVGRPTEPKLDVESLVKDFGLGVTQVELDYPAILVGDDTKNGFHFNILYSQSLSPLEQRFVLGHLLGHFLFHIQPLLARGEFEKSGWKEEVSPLVRYISGIGQQQEEIIADQFAAALLLPQGMVLKAHERLSDIKLVAEIFAVSPSLATRRLEDLQRIARPGKIQPGLDESLERPPLNYRRSKEPYPKQVDQSTQSFEPQISGDPNTHSDLRTDKARSPRDTQPSRKSMSQQKISRPRAEGLDNSPHLRNDADSLQHPRVPRQDSKQSDETNQGGLERLRALARKIDRSVNR